MKRPSLGAILVGIVPFTAICFSVPLWDRVHPMVLGLPFNLFWLVLWIFVTPLVMWFAYRIELSSSEAAAHDERGGAR